MFIKKRKKVRWFASNKNFFRLARQANYATYHTAVHIHYESNDPPHTSR